MSQLTRYLVEHLDQLTLIDIILIGIIVLLCSVGLYALFYKAYGLLFKAQSDLIVLKEQTIEAYKTNLSLAQADYGSLKSRYAELDTNFQRLASDFQHTLSDKEILERSFQQLLTNSLKLHYALSRLQLVWMTADIFISVQNIRYLYVSVGIHTAIPDAPDPSELAKESYEIEHRLGSVMGSMSDLVVLDPAKLLIPLVVPQVLGDDQVSQIKTAVIDLRNRMVPYMDRFFGLNQPPQQQDQPQ